jgi:hypothetical protein
VLLRSLLNLLEMLVVAIFSEPSNDIAVRPVNLQRVTMLLEDMIL